jgi:ATP-dependent DNA helicase DinG
MLEDAVVDLLGPGGALAGEIAGYESRPGQLAMARRVARAIDGDERLLCEAGTGTGKTLAYLLPAILSGRKVVVATGTKTLQDQIARLDLPRLQAVLAPFDFQVMKGLGNYVCLRRFHEHTRQLHLAVGDAADEVARVSAFVESSVSGDRAELEGVPEEAAIWREVTAAPELRLGKRCPYFERCFVTGMRQRAQQAQVVLANHHLFFADLALRSQWPEAQVLPPYEVVIFDEAHQIEDVATEFFGLHVSSQRLFALARDIQRTTTAPALTPRLISLARRLQAATDALASAVRDRLPPPRPGFDEVRVTVPDDLWAAGPGSVSPVARYHDLDTVLEEAETFFGGLAGSDSRERPASIANLESPPSAGEAAVFGGLGRRAAALRSDLGSMIDGPAGKLPRNHVYWVSATVRNVSLRASPVHVAPLLSAAFEAHPGPIVFTSATLSTGQGFSYLRDRLGLQAEAAEAVFASPFRFEQQALLYLACDLPDPVGGDFAAAAAARLHELCTLSRGRALLLHTSFRNLRVTESHFRRAGGFPLLVQGERPRHVLLRELRDHLGSVLLATQSFWEGVDVPGDALSLVAMDKLPFAVPDDPLTAARIASIREEGGDPFASYQLPEAGLALKQGFGRLIRTRRDRGVVAILDGRIGRRRYGATLLAALPRGCPRTESLEDVARFFTR